MIQTTPGKAKHPKALYILAMTEMWERFAYYLLAGILLLYLKDNQTGGKGLTEKDAADITGTFLALIWLPLFIGGMIADRYFGYIKSIFIGGSLLAAGYLGLILPGNTSMYISLGLIICGNGFFKPNISTLLGNIYNKAELKPLKDTAYNIFYMGINVGALLCNFAAAYLRNKYSWGWAFGAAGIGMIIGLIVFGANLKHIREGNVRKPAQKEDMGLGSIAGYVFVPAIIAAIVGFYVPGAVFHHTFMGSPSSDAFVFACIPIIGFFISIWVKANKEDKRGIGALLYIFAVSIIFWALYYQIFTGYTLWTDRYTNRTINSPVLRQGADFMGLLQEVNTEPRKVDSVNAQLMPVVDAGGHIIQTMGPDPYFQNLPKEKWPPEGHGLKVANPELYTSIVPFFIVSLTPLLVALLSWLRKRKREPTTPAKFGIALFLSGISSLVMFFAVLSVSSIYHDKVSPNWLWGTYFVICTAEIFLSPMGLSMVSKLAPPRLTSLLMGGFFLTMSLGSKIAGLMTSSWDQFPDKKVYFLIYFVAGILGSVLLFSRIRTLNATVRDKTGEA
ncbi:peptide MFS transporter [Puia sp.]|uniref:peptide MFS transporter n=1 Tax=Puia sp. TaxID=2045100 RepID=UPI002F407FB0